MKLKVATPADTLPTLDWKKEKKEKKKYGPSTEPSTTNFVMSSVIAFYK